MNLFIIGNGFDLAHGLPTRYEDFHTYLKETYPGALAILPGFNISSTMMPDGEEVFEANELVAFLTDVISKAEAEGDKWSDLETCLGNLDFGDYFEEMDELLYDETNGKEIDYFRKAYHFEDISRNFSDATIKIKDLFSDWVNTIKLDDVESNPTLESLMNRSQDYFINFNYTRVLEEVYAAENVFHLHGEQNGEIIIGHGVIKESLENEYIGTEFSLAEMHEALKKNTDEVITSHSLLFRSLKDVKSIYSYGFSFSEVDLPYIKKVCESIDTQSITWYLSAHDKDSTRNRYIDCIRECGFKGEFSIFKL